ncbi:hypothetical protein LJC45_03035 [Alistipes sp. OttesenSCG-928-B03]|nr:hypothetical protein [Alistipes sp. OttesenSCG-928-B03]
MKKIFVYMAVLLCMVACVEDKSEIGNRDINIVKLDIPETVTVKFFQGTYRFDVAEYISQSHDLDMENLKFKWGWHNTNFLMANTALKNDEIESETSYVEVVMDDPNTFDRYANYYRLRVEDQSTGITYHHDVMIKIIKPFEGSWMVMHSQNGTKVGGVEFNEDGSTDIVVDAFADRGAAALTGNPVGLGVFTEAACITIPPIYAWPAPYSYKNLFFVITDKAAESGNYCQWMGFPLTRTMSRMLSNESLITDSRIAKMTYFYGTYYYLSTVIDGRLYHAKYALRTYEAVPNEDTVTGDYYLTHAIKFANMTLLYDQLGRRILYFYNYRASGYASPISDPNAWDEAIENSAKIQNVDRASNAGIVVNPIPTDREIVYLGQGGYKGSISYNYSTSFALALGVNGNNKAYVYEFNTGYAFNRTSDPTILKLPEPFDIPEGMTDKSCFASTVDYTGLLFYSSGSKVYRLDYNTRNVKMIYEHPTGGTIEVMKFARHETFSSMPKYEIYGYPVTRSLGIAVNNGTSGELVVLELSESGSVAKNSGTRDSKMSFGGFGKIKDIVFL